MKKILFLFLITILAVGSSVFASGHGGEKDAKKEEKKEDKKKLAVKQVGADEIRKAIDGGVRFFNIDTRDEKHFKKSHILNAVNLPLENLSEESLAKIVPSKKDRIVFYCQDGDCGGVAAAKALELGYEKVYNYRTGFDDWENRSFPVAP